MGVAIPVSGWTLKRARKQASGAAVENHNALYARVKENKISVAEVNGTKLDATDAV
jgi:hypothetical protein